MPGGPNRPNRGAIPPVPPGPLHAPNLTPPTIEGLTVQDFLEALRTFFEVLARAEAQCMPPPMLALQLANLDQLKVLLDALPDYHADDEQPSYVLAIPCRPIVVALAALLPSCMPLVQAVDVRALETHMASDAILTQPVSFTQPP